MTKALGRFTSALSGEYSYRMSDLQRKVDAWLGEQGFPLEFLAAKSFSRHGMVALQGQYVRDSRSGVLREADVVAVIQRQDRDVVCRVSVVVECKWSRTKPWVVFIASERPSPEEDVAQMISSSFGQGVLWHLCSDSSFQNLVTARRTPLFGFGGRQALAERDQFYVTMQGVVGAALALATADDPPPGMRRTEGPIMAHVVYPIVVIDGTLFEAHLEGDHLVTRQQARSTVRWRAHESLQGTPVTVEIVTLAELEKYAQELAIHCTELAAHMMSPAREVSSALNTGIREKLIKKLPPLIPVPPILERIMSGVSS